LALIDSYDRGWGINPIGVAYIQDDRSYTFEEVGELSCRIANRLLELGMPDEKWGEAVKAVVELNPDQQVTAEEIIALCKERLGSVMAPKSVDFVPVLPRSTIGKVLKKDLRAQYCKIAAEKSDRGILQ
jgi:hypothetical protein